MKLIVTEGDRVLCEECHAELFNPNDAQSHMHSVLDKPRVPCSSCGYDPEGPQLEVSKRFNFPGVELHMCRGDAVAVLAVLEEATYGDVLNPASSVASMIRDLIAEIDSTFG